tara:strand:- start:712 stop:918 length:207 start_codon:yes stop_codon:yes gene_type:complete
MNNKYKNLKKYLKLIKEIEKVRSRNNKNWMDLYRLAFEVAPSRSINIIKKILKEDKSVSKLAKKLTIK